MSHDIAKLIDLLLDVVGVGDRGYENDRGRLCPVQASYIQIVCQLAERLTYCAREGIDIRPLRVQLHGRHGLVEIAERGADLGRKSCGSLWTERLEAACAIEQQLTCLQRA